MSVCKTVQSSFTPPTNALMFYSAHIRVSAGSKNYSIMSNPWASTDTKARVKWATAA